MARSNSDNGVCGMDFSMMSILWRHRESMPTQNISCFRAKTQKSDRKTGLIHPFNGLIQQSPSSPEFSGNLAQPLPGHAFPVGLTLLRLFAEERLHPPGQTPQQTGRQRDVL